MKLGDRYRKLVVRWRSPKAVSVALVLILVSILVSLLFIEYLSAHGLEDKVEHIRLGAVNVPLRMLLLPSVGIALLFVFAWAYLVQERAYVKAVPRPQQERTFVTLKIAKYAALTVALFTTFLFVPYLLGSSLFLGFLGWLVSVAGFLEPYILRGISSVSSTASLDENWKYPLSLNLAALATVLSALFLARRGRKTISLKRR